MISCKIKDFFTSFDKKNTVLYNLLRDRIKIEDIRYLSTYGKCGMPPTDSYILINKIREKFRVETFLYGFWESGMIVFNSIEICNGKCKIGIEYNGK